VQNILSFSLITKNIKFEINFPIILYGCETWSLTLREEIRLKVIGEKSAEESIWA
jgi:hypothetical protein